MADARDYEHHHLCATRRHNLGILIHLAEVAHLIGSGGQKDGSYNSTADHYGFRLKSDRLPVKPFSQKYGLKDASHDVSFVYETIFFAIVMKR